MIVQPNQSIESRAKNIIEGIAARQLQDEDAARQDRRRQEEADLQARLHQAEAEAGSRLAKLAPMYARRREAAIALAQAVAAWWEIEEPLRAEARTALEELDRVTRQGGYEISAMREVVADLRQRAGLPRTHNAIDVALPPGEGGALARTVIGSLLDGVLAPGVVSVGLGAIRS